MNALIEIISKLIPSFNFIWECLNITNWKYHESISEYMRISKKERKVGDLGKGIACG